MQFLTFLLAAAVAAPATAAVVEKRLNLDLWCGKDRTYSANNCEDNVLYNTK
ncbi:hypothetical protein E4U54_001539 [Claviceps lovelessii]|nr:hypothetical protein E4U54_001539 [Claviceps lovelessii]